jgi:hypothetical protein
MPKKNVPKKDSEQNAPVFLVRPAFKNLGLDYLHITLIVLAVILAVLAYSLSGFKGTTLPSQASSVNCTFGVLNGKCATPSHTSAEALLASEKVLASYSSINSTLSLLPYYSIVNRSVVSYLPNAGEWLVAVPYINPLNGENLQLSMLLYDSNLTLAVPFQQMIKPITFSNYTVVSKGVVSIPGKSACTQSAPFPTDLFIDPYSPGDFQSISEAINASRSADLNVSYEFIFTGYSARFYQNYGESTTQFMSKYLLCAVAQHALPQFLSNLSIAFHGQPLSNYTLAQVATASNLKPNALEGCLLNSTAVLQNQQTLADFYNITSGSLFVLNCKYISIPQTLGEGINYTGSTLGGH